MDYYSERGAQPVIPVLSYNDGTAMKQLIITEPAPGELLITGPAGSRTHWGLLPAMAIGVILIAALIAYMTLMAGEDIAGKIILIVICLPLAVISAVFLSTSRIPDCVWLSNGTLRVSPRSRLWTSASVYTKDELNDVVARRHWGLRPGRATLYLEMDVLRITIFANCPKEDVQAVAKIIRDRLGMGSDKH